MIHINIRLIPIKSWIFEPPCKHSYTQCKRLSMFNDIRLQAHMSLQTRISICAVLCLIPSDNALPPPLPRNTLTHLFRKIYDDPWRKLKIAFTKNICRDKKSNNTDKCDHHHFHWNLGTVPVKILRTVPVPDLWTIYQCYYKLIISCFIRTQKQ